MQLMCFLYLQQDSWTAPGPECQTSFLKDKDEGCEATKVWRMMMVLECMTQVGGVGRVSARGFNKEDQEIRGSSQGQDRAPKDEQDYWTSITRRQKCGLTYEA